MKSSGRLFVIFVLVGLLMVLPLASAFGHEIADGNARVEVIQEFTPGTSSSPNEAYAWINWANPTIRNGGWSWMAVSISNPLLGDCHNGETASDKLRVARSGWIKFAGDSYAKPMASVISESGTVTVRTRSAYVTKKLYYGLQGTSGDNWREWFAGYYDPDTGVWDWILWQYPGPKVTQMKCVTTGGWASAFDDGIGTATVGPVYYQTISGTTYPKLNPSHRVRNSPYYIYDVYPDKWQFYGNN